jgi:cytochrome P450
VTLPTFKTASSFIKMLSHTEKTASYKANVAVLNTLQKLTITFIKPDLIREVLSPDTILKYKKLDLLVKGIKGVFGDGILFSEGDIWKNKRKIISKTFNFELLRENIPKISGICESWLDQFDQENTTS